jgi:ferredoxin
MGCGVCVDMCEQGALTLDLDADKGVPLEINALMSQALGLTSATTLA